MMRFVLVLLALFVASSAKRVTLEPEFTFALPPGWTEDNTRPSPMSPFSFKVALSHRDVHKLRATLEAVSDPSSASFGQHWTHQQIKDSFAPAQSVVASVVAHFSSFDGATAVLDNSGVFVRVDTTVQQAKKMLATEFHSFTFSTGARVVRAKQHYSLPSQIAQHVDLVSNVVRFPNIDCCYPHNHTLANEAYPVTPWLIHSLYGVTLPEDIGSSANWQGVVSFLGQYFSPEDLAQFHEMNHIKPNPIAQVIGDGGNDPDKVGMEATLDVQFLTGVAPIKTIVWSTNGTVDNGNEPFMTWLADVASTEDIPFVLSISYQDFENTRTVAYAERANVEFMKVGLRGTTLVTGSGDWGVSCSANGKKFIADFPSDSPYLVSVGATAFANNAPPIQDGAVWDNTHGFMSSGGFSTYFDRPAWQDAPVENFLDNHNKVPTTWFNSSGRAFPDVSALGAGFQIVYNGKLVSIGGTSAATPTFAGILSLINEQRLTAGKSTLGWVTPNLWGAYAKQQGAYTDVLQQVAPNHHGNCPGFDITPGWDPYTGIGTPNFGPLAEYLVAL